MSQPFVFFVDVDNTLLNNDQVKQEIRHSLVFTLGQNEAEHFWQHHDEFRAYRKLVDFPNITREYCAEKHGATCEHTIGSIFTGINFSGAFYQDALKALVHLRTLGSVYIFSEGDPVYQKMKIEKSGIAKAADGVFLYKHKLDHLPDILSQFSGSIPVFIDDRDDKLIEIKKKVPEAVTVVVCQGHYAEPDCPTSHSADKVIESVTELLAFTADSFSLA